LLSLVPPLVGELEEQCAARGVLGVLGGANAVVGVTIIELSEEHGVIPGGAEGGPTLPSAITLAGRSRNAATQFSSAVLIFFHFLDNGGLAQGSAAVAPDSAVIQISPKAYGKNARRTPTTTIGHAAAAPPSSATNSRRPMPNMGGPSLRDCRIVSLPPGQAAGPWGRPELI